MKTITILIIMIYNPNGIVHKAEYQVKADSCYIAEQKALDAAFDKYVESGKASEVSIEECSDA